jgi:kynurenine formamidase
VNPLHTSAASLSHGNQAAPDSKDEPVIASVANNDRPRRVVDLSHPLRTGMPVYPGDPDVTIEPFATLENDGIALTHLDLGSHSGTHLDAPSHSIHGGRTIDRITPEEVTGNARVVRLLQLNDDATITAGQIDDATAGIRLPAIVMLCTGWDHYFGTPRYLHHPHLDVEGARLLIERGVHVLAVDTLNPDATLDAAGAPVNRLPVHELILGGDGLIAENLADVTALPTDRDINVSLVPLRIAGADGSPIRAIAQF